MAEKKKAIELKRVVMVKAIVTESFKQNLVKELERAVSNLENQAAQMTDRSKSYLEGLKKKGLMQKAAAFKHQMEEEKSRQVAGSEFVQGPLEGPVTVQVGDNLYRKVGGAEIIVKDGIIQEIRGE
jgi:hypothetical protein